MSEAGEHYEDACQAGDTAAHLAALPAPELHAVARHAEWLMRENSAKGGIPAIVKWACVIEAAARFLRSHDPRPS